jgi:hypothetical protein
LILLLAVFAGLLAGLLRAKWRKCKLEVPHLRLAGLVLLAYLLQWLAFRLPSVIASLPQAIIPAGLVASQLILLVFAWFNRRQPGVWMLGLGLALNFTAIVSNGGLMPISPETVARITPENTWEVGQRFANSKDIVLTATEMRMGFLSDRYVLPGWFPYRVAFSLGDVLIGLGAFTLMWSLPGPSQTEVRKIKEQ